MQVTIRGRSIKGSRVALALPLCASFLTIVHPTGAVGQDTAYVVVERPWTPAQLRERAGKASGGVWSDDDVLTFYHEANAQAVRVDGTFQVPLRRVDGSESWTVSIRVPGLSKALVSYRFVRDNDTGVAHAGQTGVLQHWHGTDAPAPPARATTLTGEVIDMTLDSDALGERRSLSVYLPPGYRDGAAMPVVLMADGEALEGYARTLEPLFVAGAIPPAVLVGVHAGKYMGDPSSAFDPSKDLRSIEYLEGFDKMMSGVDSTRFSRHERFFAEEVPALIERRVSVSRDAKDWIVFGTSNGASFAVTVGRRFPNRFGSTIAFAAGWPPLVAASGWPQSIESKYYLLVGSLERAGFRSTTTGLAETLRSRGARLVLREPVGGHDSYLWQNEFPAALRWVLGDH